MEKLSFFNALFFFATSIFAQVNLLECSVIVLENNNEVIALINGIQSGQLFYQKCPDTTSQQFSIPVDIIKHIRESNGVIQSLSAHLVELPVENSSKNEYYTIDKWLFWKKDNNKTRTISRDQNIKVVYTTVTDKVRKAEGKWIMLTNKELILDTEANSSLAIPKKNIRKIIVLKKGRRIPKKNRWTIFLITAGAIFLLSLFKIFDRADQQGRIQSITGALAVSLFISLIVTALVAVAILIISSINAKSIKHPFGDKWEITYSSNENNDLREFYKQP